MSFFNVTYCTSYGSKNVRVNNLHSFRLYESDNAKNTCALFTTFFWSTQLYTYVSDNSITKRVKMITDNLTITAVNKHIYARQIYFSLLILSINNKKKTFFVFSAIYFEFWLSLTNRKNFLLSIGNDRHTISVLLVQGESMYIFICPYLKV